MKWVIFNEMSYLLWIEYFLMKRVIFNEMSIFDFDELLLGAQNDVLFNIIIFEPFFSQIWFQACTFRLGSSNDGISRCFSTVMTLYIILKWRK